MEKQARLTKREYNKTQNNLAKLVAKVASQLFLQSIEVQMCQRMMCMPGNSIRTIIMDAFLWEGLFDLDFNSICV